MAASSVSITEDKFLGKGGFASVYLHYDEKTNAFVAVKRIDVGPVDSEDANIIKELKAVRKEISMMKDLNHKRIVRYIREGRESNIFFIYMEYVCGGSVENKLNKDGAFSEETTKKYTLQLLEGLSYLHHKRIIHRDVKGSNILCDGKGNIKLADFGISKQMNRLYTLTSKASKNTATKGTGYWMAPEVIKADKYGTRADIWSTGATVVEMLTTHPPWYELEQLQAMFRIANLEKGGYALDSKISRDAEDFLTQTFMLEEQRPRADELLQHSWLNIVYDEHEHEYGHVPEDEGCDVEQGEHFNKFRPSDGIREIDKLEDKGHMVQVIEVLSDEDGGVTPIFHAEILEEVVSANPNLEKFIVISISGRQRSGKSFLTNFLICHLRHLEKNPTDDDTTWLEEEAHISGVVWGQGPELITKGIWMWSEPFVLCKAKEKFGVLLLDCQGLYNPDDPSAEVKDTLITLFVSELSNLQIVNVIGNMRSSDLEHLENSISFANISDLERKTEKTFNTLIVVHRDWQESEDYGCHPDFFAHLKAKRKLKPGEKLIHEAFTRCIEFILPSPGRAIRRGSAEDNHLMSDLMKDEYNRMFLQWATKLGHYLFLDLPDLENLVLTGRNQLVTHIKKLKHYTHGAHIPKFRSPADVLVHGAVMDVLHHVESTLYPEFLSSINVSGDDAKIKQVSNKALAEAFIYIGVCENKIDCRSETVSQSWRFVREKVEKMYEAAKQERISQWLAEEQNKKKKILKVAARATAIAIATGAIGVATGGLLPAAAFAAAAAGGFIGRHYLIKLLRPKKRSNF